MEKDFVGKRSTVFGTIFNQPTNLGHQTIDACHTGLEATLWRKQENVKVKPM